MVDNRKVLLPTSDILQLRTSCSLMGVHVLGVAGFLVQQVQGWTRTLMFLTGDACAVAAQTMICETTYQLSDQRTWFAHMIPFMNFFKNPIKDYPDMKYIRKSGLGTLQFLHSFSDTAKFESTHVELVRVLSLATAFSSDKYGEHVPCALHGGTHLQFQFLESKGRTIISSKLSLATQYV